MATNHEKALREDIDMVSGGTVKFRMERHLEALLAERDAEIARLRAALAQIRDAAHEHGVAWTQRVASKALEDV